MSKTTFAHLHNHTEYSLLDGISRIPDLVRRTRELGMTAAAITDHGSLYGAVNFYSECRQQDIKPIIGCEVYVAKDSRLQKNADERSPHHLVLLAETNQGYQNLLQLVSRANTEGFHYRPRVDRELLHQYGDGLICLSGCASAEVPRLLAQGHYDQAREAAAWYRDTFAHRYFLELQRHEHVPDLPGINRGLVRLHGDLNIPLLATNDCHYVSFEDHEHQDVYICIQTSAKITDSERLRMEDNSYYVKSPDEMTELFADLPAAVGLTNEVAEQCNVELDFGRLHLPRYPVPGTQSPDEYLRETCADGFLARYPQQEASARERLQHELGVIQRTQFASYFLVVWDIIRFAREQGIRYNVRGSAASSVVLYSLAITDIDPLGEGLVFERFLNDGRKEMPDIDMDFQDDRRDEVLRYVIDRYGDDRVAHIITFGTMGRKAAVRNVSRALDVPYRQAEQLSQLVPDRARSLANARANNQELRQQIAADPRTELVFHHAEALEGITHHVATHAAGIIIADEPLQNLTPLQPLPGTNISPVLMTQYPMDDIAHLGLLKMDFLGLTSLTIIDRTLSMVAERQDEEIARALELDTLPANDPATYAMLSNGRTTNVFQLESAGIQRALKALKPNHINDVCAINALYRPGPMEQIDRFVNARHGREQASYPHPDLEDILDETYGVIVYQEQVLHILQNFAGYTLGEADTVRKAMGKKLPALMAEERERFVSGAVSQGYDRAVGNQVFDLIEPFAGYAFNKAHSFSYARISYWTAYLKTHHPLEYMTAVLSCRRDATAYVSAAIAECGVLGIGILAPSINRSEADYSIEDANHIRLGLSAVKQVGHDAAGLVAAERRDHGDYASWDDFQSRTQRIRLGRNALVNLAQAGAFDELLPRSRAMVAAQHGAGNRHIPQGQNRLFTAEPTPDAETPEPPATTTQLRTWETEALGFPVTSHPSLRPERPAPAGTLRSIVELHELEPNARGTVIGYVSAQRGSATRTGQPYLRITLGLLDGNIEAIAWSNVLTLLPDIWEQGQAVSVTGTIQQRDDTPSLIIESAAALDETATDDGMTNTGVKTQTTDDASWTKPAHFLLLAVNDTNEPSNDTDGLRRALRRCIDHPGDDPVLLEITMSNGQRATVEITAFTVQASADLADTIRQMPGIQDTAWR